MFTDICCKYIQIISLPQRKAPFPGGAFGIYLLRSPVCWSFLESRLRAPGGALTLHLTIGARSAVGQGVSERSL